MKSRIGLLEEYNYRLGLSATPRRYFDEEGSELLLHYFGETVFRYDLKKAIEDGHLTPYNYYPIIVNLSDEEYQEYIDLTRSIIRQSNASDETESRLLEILTMKRSLITKKAVNKISSFQELISKLNNLSTVYNLLVYCQDSEQLVKAQKILNTHRIINHKLTDKESTQDRNTILKGFANKEYQAIVAMNCLDEGIDVPSTESAIILASSGNPRQYIQRRGRVLRKSDGKEIAHIYDFIVLPPPIHLDQSLEKYDRMIIKKELVRVWEFLDGANNKLQIINSVSPLMLHYNAYIDIEVENEN